MSSAQQTGNAANPSDFASLQAQYMRDDGLWGNLKKDLLQIVELPFRVDRE